MDVKYKSTQYNALFAHKYMYMYGKGIGGCFKFMTMVAWRDHGGRMGKRLCLQGFVLFTSTALGMQHPLRAEH